MAMVGSVNRMRALVEKCLDISTDMGNLSGVKEGSRTSKGKAGVSSGR